MAVFQNNLLAGAAAQSSTTPVHTIDQSIRFNSAEAAFITQDSGGSFSNQSTSTISMWVKRGNTISNGNSNTFYGAFYGNGGRYDWMQFDSSDRWGFGTRNTDATTADAISADYHRVTNMTFRDPSAWYHLVLVLDSTNNVDSDRIRMYVNGERITSLQTSLTIPQNRGFYTMADGVENNIGAYEDNTGYSSNLYFDGCMAEVALIDGTAYDASNFGEFNNSGIWIPKDISELTFGSNGIYYKGQDASALGDDSSGNGNDGTLRNIAAHDQLLDTPTNNFATFNRVYADVTGFTDVTYKNGNLQADATSSQFDHTTSTFNLPKSGKWYFEHYLGGRYTGFGICIVGQEGTISSGYGFGTLSTSQGFGFQDNVVYNGNSATVTFGGQSSLGDILNCAFDVDNNKVFLGINGTYYAADNGDDGNPSAGTNPTVTTSFSLSTNDIILGFYFSTADGTSFVNFGQEGTFGGNKTAGGNSDANGIGNFFNTVPTNYLALCSKNVGS